MGFLHRKLGLPGLLLSCHSQSCSALVFLSSSSGFPAPDHNPVETLFLWSQVETSPWLHLHPHIYFWEDQRDASRNGVYQVSEDPGSGFEMLPVYPSSFFKEEGLDKMHLRHRAECTRLPGERAPSVQGGCFCGHSAPWNSYRIPLSAPDSSSGTILSLSHSTDKKAGAQKGEGMEKSMLGLPCLCSFWPLK